MIIDANSIYYDKVYDFIKKSTNIYDIDEKVVANACAIIDDNEVIGVLSFEKFSQYGLIRYFVFKRIVEENIIRELLKEVSKKALNNNIKILITLVNKEEIVDLFKSLDFIYLDNNNIFIDENNINDTRFKNSYVLKYHIN